MDDQGNNEDLSLAPDSELFETASEAGRQKKSISDRQRQHLMRAREKAKQKAAERREIERKYREEEENRKKIEEEPPKPVVKRQTPEADVEVIYEAEEQYNSEDDDFALFENWMKHMGRYKQFKNQRKEADRKKKEDEERTRQEEAARNRPPTPPPQPQVQRDPSPKMMRISLIPTNMRRHRGVRIR